MFWVRLRSSVILVILAGITMFAGAEVLLAMMAFLSVVAYMELAGATGVRERKDKGETDQAQREALFNRWKKNGLEKVGILGIILYYALLYANMNKAGAAVQTGILFSIVCVFMGGMFVYVFGFPRYQAHQVMAAFFSFFYGPVCLSFVFLTRELGREMSSERAMIGLYAVWLILISSWGCDTCAYCVGMLIGKHKMSPVLSPKKSVEGAIGGVLGAALLGALYGYLLTGRLREDGRLALFFALICGVGALISMVGDLAASAVKRDHEIKDYGKLIPGHGGIMDRFDSVIVAAPIVFLGIALATGLWS